MIAIFIIGYYFHRLAKKHSRNAIVWALAGVGFFYVVQLVIGLIYFLFADGIDVVDSMDSGTETLLNIIALVMAGCCAFGLHKWLDHKWSESPVLLTTSDTLDEELIQGS